MERKLRPQSEWIIANDPSLRIVSDDLWQKVQARLVKQRDATRELRTRHGPESKARTGRHPKHLFSGLLRCGECGGSFSTYDGPRYACYQAFRRGPTVCKCIIKVSRKLIETRLLEGIKTKLFTPEALGLFKSEVRRALVALKAAKRSDSADLKRRLQAIDGKISNIVGAVEDGRSSPALTKRLEELEAERVQLAKMLEIEPPPTDNVEILLPRVIDTYAAMVADLATVIPGREMSKARNILSALVGSEIRIKRVGREGLAAELQGDFAGLVDLACSCEGPKAAAALVSQATRSRSSSRASGSRGGNRPRAGAPPPGPRP
jgi:hypothetical protein